jgi:ElaB/YqjD/DUF883 family membrane-anchored ribosome-binding protein
MTSDINDPVNDDLEHDDLHDDLEQAADAVVRDVKRGAARVEHAVEEGAAAVDDALYPGFGTQLRDVLRSMAQDPASTPALARDLVQDHPIASLLTAAAVGAGVAKLFGTVRSR